jgi:hypothetical protein
VTSFLEPAALHQTRFRTPGVTPDSRGVVVGQKGLCLFPSLDRAVAFFRAYAEEGSLDELLPTLNIERVISSLKTREVLVSMAAESSYRMDRVAQVARLAGGDVFTGTQRHFVRYRDARSPLGYDIVEIVDAKADVVLYAEAYRQAYNVERQVPFGELILKLQPYVAPVGDKHPLSRIWVTAETGIGNALVGYLFRWRVKAKVALAEWPPESAFDEGVKRLHVFDVDDPPARVVKLLRSLPGVHVFEPVAGNVGVEVGFKHPVALESCQGVFAKNGLTLFMGKNTGGSQVTIVDPVPPLAPVQTLVRSDVRLDDARGGSSARHALTASMPNVLDLSLRLASSQLAWRNVVASVVPIAEREWLARMLYVLPPRTLESIRMAITEEAIYLWDPNGIEGVPLGRFYSRVAERVYVPAGMTLVPAVSSSVLEELVAGAGGGHVFFIDGEERPRVVSSDAFGPVSRRVLKSVAGAHVHADAPDRADIPLPLLSYGPESRFPLWGVPGKTEPKAG